MPSDARAAATTRPALADARVGLLEPVQAAGSTSCALVQGDQTQHLLGVGQAAVPVRPPSVLTVPVPSGPRPWGPAAGVK